ncbi:ABC transporter ATP-binding protein [Clostridia bacterium]|nr:ABC transporter ATP-binding protein [Clostridia bacterium]
MSASINIKNVTKTFETMTALDDVSIDIKAGEFVTLVGTSGCGKSTLLRILSGLETVTDGEVTCDEKPIKGTNANRIMVFQEHTLLPFLSIRKNIAFALKGTKLYKTEKKNIDHWLSLAGLTEFANKYPHQLSGGMRQRAALVRALAVQPEVLMLDEPLGALDNFTRMTLQDELLKLWQEQNNTIIMVTHDVDEAVYLSQKIIVMTPRPGRIKEALEVSMSYPRNHADSEFIELRTTILKNLNYAKEVKEQYEEYSI